MRFRKVCCFFHFTPPENWTRQVDGPDGYNPPSTHGRPVWACAGEDALKVHPAHPADILHSLEIGKVPDKHTNDKILAREFQYCVERGKPNGLNGTIRTA